MLFDVLAVFKYIHPEVIMNFLRKLPLNNHFYNQNTINQEITFTGVGIHDGKAVSMKLIPADVNTGIIFKRVDIKKNNIIPVKYKNIVKSKFCSKIENEYGISVYTLEHLLATLSSLYIDNLIIEINSPELPAMDGSANEYISRILKVGKRVQNQTRKYLKIKKELSVSIDKRWIRVSPSNQLNLNLEINYPDTIIGKDKLSYSHNEKNFIDNICYARTFTLASNIEKLKASGFGIGGNLNNAIVVDKNKIINQSGLRCKNEFIKHKVLDCIGDLYLSGYQILGDFQSFAPGHELNQKILLEIFSSESNYECVHLNDLITPHLSNEIDIRNYSIA